VTWLTWRQYRIQAAIASAVLAAFAAVLVVTGLSMAAQWHTLLTGCSATSTCGSLGQTISLGGSIAGHDLVLLSLAAPAVFGMLVGAPLLAHEFEARTSEFAWTQSITRTRWLLVKVGWLLLAAAVWGGVIAALVTWWSGPRNALMQNAFEPGTFDMQGIVPVGYAVFATALGIAAGALLRRTLPAVAIVLGGFIGLRLWISQAVRQHFMTPVTGYLSATGNPAPVGSWNLGGGMSGPNGLQVAQSFSKGAVFDGMPISSLPQACQSLANSASPRSTGATFRCLNAGGYHIYVTYQPLSRYWAFQGIETGTFATLALALLAVTLVVVTRRDA